MRMMGEPVVCASAVAAAAAAAADTLQRGILRSLLRTRHAEAFDGVPEARPHVSQSVLARGITSEDTERVVAAAAANGVF